MEKIIPWSNQGKAISTLSKENLSMKLLLPCSTYKKTQKKSKMKIITSKAMPMPIQTAQLYQPKPMEALPPIKQIISNFETTLKPS